MTSSAPQPGKRIPKGSSRAVVHSTTPSGSTSSAKSANRNPNRESGLEGSREGRGEGRSENSRVGKHEGRGEGRRGFFLRKNDTGTTAGISNKDLMRPGIVPGIAGVIAMFIGMATYVSDWYITVLFVISILAAVLAVMSFQAVELWKRIAFTPLFAVIAVFWNPIFRLNAGFDSGAQWWLLVQLVAAAIFFVGGFLLKTRAPKR